MPPCGGGWHLAPSPRVAAHSHQLAGVRTPCGLKRGGSKKKKGMPTDHPNLFQRPVFPGCEFRRFDSDKPFGQVKSLGPFVPSVRYIRSMLRFEEAPFSFISLAF
jgi:hypothetical protein